MAPLLKSSPVRTRLSLLGMVSFRLVGQGDFVRGHRACVRRPAGNRPGLPSHAIEWFYRVLQMEMDEC